MSSFCSAKATHIFSAKNFRKLYTESAKTVNEMTLNDALNNWALEFKLNQDKIQPTAIDSDKKYPQDIIHN